ncbi:MAG: phytanoyl-CoA dioxygenase family protein, partial [Gammaproteobacteria bacterium]|nr:phytanoyl-CoA dioxygenase family protein [Gammaproteobacteria bacterium]
AERTGDLVMTYALAPDQVNQYQRDGFLFPLDVFDNSRVEDILEQLKHTRTAAREQGLEAELTQLLRSNTHYILPFVSELARAPQLLDRVESILGPNILLWSAEFFIKGARTDKIVSWHQDLTYWGLGETNQEMTAWLALSDVNVESGCMRFVPGSHHQQILPHRDTFDAANLLSRGQEVAVDVAESDAVNVILDPGQVSFHHGRMFHASGPNRSAQDRIGMAFRFITPEVRQSVAKRDYAMLVRGIDEGRNWIHVAPPRRQFDPAELKLPARIRQDQSAALDEGAEQELYTAD